MKCGAGGAVKDAEIRECPADINTDPERALRRLQFVRFSPRTVSWHGHETLIVFYISEQLCYISELVQRIVKSG